MATANGQDMDFVGKVVYVFKLWEESWKALLSNIVTFLVLYILPSILFSLFVILSFTPFLFGFNENSTISPLFFTMMFFSVIGSIVVYIIFYPATIVAQLQSVQNNKISIGEALKKGLSYVPAFIVYGLLAFAAITIPALLVFALMFVLVGFLLLPIVFAWAVVIAMFSLIVPYVIVNENLDGIAAINRTIALFKTNWQWFVAVALIMMAASAFGGIPFVGPIVSIAISVVYFCMPAIVYTRHLAPAKTPVAVKANKVVAKSASKSPKPKK